MPQKLTQEAVIARFKTINDNATHYDYSQVEYVNKRTKVIIGCNKCNKPFEQTPHNHYTQKSGCPNCYGTKQKTNEQIITEFKEVHNDTFEYSLVDYINNYTKVKIKCKKCQGVFEQEPQNHLRGHGCNLCADNAYHDKFYYSGKPTLLYYVKINNLYKIGLTIHDIKTRFVSDKGVSVEVIATKLFKDGAEAFEVEQRILTENKQSQYKGTPILRGGNTELFVEDINPQLR